MADNERDHSWAQLIPGKALGDSPAKKMPAKHWGKAQVQRLPRGYFQKTRHQPTCTRRPSRIREPRFGAGPESHVIPIGIDVARGKRSLFKIYGSDYPTPMGPAYATSFTLPISPMRMRGASII
jgi:hypothetical protein